MHVIVLLDQDEVQLPLPDVVHERTVAVGDYLIL